MVVRASPWPAGGHWPSFPAQCPALSGCVGPAEEWRRGWGWGRVYSGCTGLRPGLSWGGGCVVSMTSSHSSPGDGQKLTEQRAPETPGARAERTQWTWDRGHQAGSQDTPQTSLTSEAPQNPLAKLPMMQALCKEQTCPTALPGGSSWPCTRGGKSRQASTFPPAPSPGHKPAGQLLHPP